MKRVKIGDLRPGMITAEDVYNYNDQLVFPKGHKLDQSSIDRLDMFSIMSIRVEDQKETTFSPEPEQDRIKPEHYVEMPYSERVKASAEFKEFQKKFEENLGVFKNSLNEIVQKGSDIDVKGVLTSTMDLINTSKGRVNIFDMLQNMRQYDDLTFAHCLNVALIANVLAGWLHMSEEDIQLVTLCGVFHDIGKLAIPDEIVKKPGKLTAEEYKLIKTHTIEGYKILQPHPISEHIKNAALMHHERCDGGGYPFAFQANQIDQYAKIIAIADVYDAMTAPRVYRGALCPFKVIDIFEQEGLQRYDAKYILTFLENVVLTYMGNSVRLSDGREGKIVFINKQTLSKPMVESNGQFIDLSKERELSIEMIL